MVRIHIGSESRLLQDVDPRWITRQIEQRQHAGDGVCVRVEFDEADVGYTLSAGNCSGYGSRITREYTRREQRILEVWKQLVSRDLPIHADCVIAFTQRLPQLL